MNNNPFLKGLPTMYWINLERAEERRTNMLNNLNNYELRNVRINGFDGKYNEIPDWIIQNKKNEKIDTCICISHINAIKKFLENNESIGLICEDDLSFDYCEYWNENIMNIVDRLPSDWEVFQMSVVITTQYGIKKHLRNKHDFMRRQNYQFGATAYLITREGAQRLINLYEREEDGKIILDFSKPKANDPKVFRSTSEHIVFGSLVTYTMRLPYFTYSDFDISNSAHQNSESHIFSNCKKEIENAWIQNNKK